MGSTGQLHIKMWDIKFACENTCERNYVLKLWKRHWVHWDDYLLQSPVIVKMSVAVKDFKIDTLKFGGESDWVGVGNDSSPEPRFLQNVSTGKQPH